MLDRWLPYTTTIVGKLAWADSSLVVLDKWLFYRGGRLSRFYCAWIKMETNFFKLEWMDQLWT